ncbi:Gibberellin 3-beta-dioxygenase 1 [Morella rubra]|uniref:gibberellin 3beta-dioxygenase n=1 Tax=Morella rubra TaxID=262757 RepID=A0A6A1UW00_9ROSI|nr:Gibberellin 3-beta-dioxygenase 1 [Morella rubra]
MSTMNEIYESHLYPSDRIVPVDFEAVRTAPESYVWPKSDVFSSGEQSSVPVIDLMDPNATEHIRQALETWGVFQLLNHGISSSLIEEVENEIRRLFALPAQQKLKVLRSTHGSTGYGLPRIAKNFSQHLWHEGFTVMGSPVDHARKLWPHDYERFCDVMENYQKAMKGLAERLIRLIFLSLGICDEEIRWLGSSDDSGSNNITAALQLNSYPPCPDPDDGQVMGLGPHTDTSLITILRQGDINGLEIFKDGVGWILVPPLAGAFVVNLGDLFQILSNARFRSVIHRAVVNGTRQRYSFAYFYDPPMDFVLSPFCNGLNSGQAPRYRSMTVKDYISVKFNNFMTALSSIEI